MPVVQQDVKTLTGNYAAAHAARLARIGAGLFFPIGPADEVMETVREFIDSGELPNAEILQLEHEKDCMSTQIALARLGVRTMFPTCGEGLLWTLSEAKYAAGSRLPLLVVDPSRGISPPTTMYCDHDDFLLYRDMSWLMFYCEDPQDVLDTILQAYKIAEDRSVLLPAIVGYDGYGGTSHSSFRVAIPDGAAVDQFLPFHKPNPDKDYACVDWHARFKERRFQRMRGHYMEKKFLQCKALEDAKEVILRVGDEYKATFGRDNVGTIQPYRCQDAEVIVVTMGAMSSTTRFVIDAMRDAGTKVGMVKLRVFRPFPKQELADELAKAKVVVVLERNSLAALFTEIKAAIYDSIAVTRPLVMGRIVGIGGREITYVDVSKIISEGLEAANAGKAERPLAWEPIKSIDFDPFEEDVGE